MKAFGVTRRTRWPQRFRKAERFIPYAAALMQFPQVTHFKQFFTADCLTLFETGTYTQSMRVRRVLSAVVLLVAVALTWPGHLSAQAIQRSLYVSVVNDAGAPVPDLGPADFIVREDNVAREVLHVAPADEPMHIALLVDNSTASRDNISHFRTALPPFVTSLTNPNRSEERRVGKECRL